MTSSKTFAWFVICLLMAADNAPAALPEPPKQHEPWPLPSGTAVPDYVVKVAAVLFSAGLADPRSGVYRKAEIFNLHNGNATVQTHAWAFPGGYAVCWNGLIYRIRTAGAPADLEKDVRTIVGAQPWSGRMPFSREDPAEASFWSDMQVNQTIMPASIALLLRLGRTDLAAQLWQAPKVADDFGNVRKHDNIHIVRHRTELIDHARLVWVVSYSVASNCN